MFTRAFPQKRARRPNHPWLATETCVPSAVGPRNREHSVVALATVLGSRIVEMPGIQSSITHGPRGSGPATVFRVRFQSNHQYKSCYVTWESLTRQVALRGHGMLVSDKKICTVQVVYRIVVPQSSKATPESQKLVLASVYCCLSMQVCGCSFTSLTSVLCRKMVLIN